MASGYAPQARQKQMAFIARDSQVLLYLCSRFYFGPLKGASRNVASTWENRLLVPGGEGGAHVTTVSSHKSTPGKKEIPRKCLGSNKHDVISTLEWKRELATPKSQK